MSWLERRFGGYSGVTYTSPFQSRLSKSRTVNAIRADLAAETPLYKVFMVLLVLLSGHELYPCSSLAMSWSRSVEAEWRSPLLSIATARAKCVATSCQQGSRMRLSDLMRCLLVFINNSISSRG